MIKQYFFKVFLNAAYSLAPHKGAAEDSINQYYFQEKKHKDKEQCEERQNHMNKFNRPRTYPKTTGNCPYTDYFEGGAD